MYIEEDNWNTYGVPILSKATIRATITNVVASMQLEGDFFFTSSSSQSCGNFLTEEHSIVSTCVGRTESNTARDWV